MSALNSSSRSNDFVGAKGLSSMFVRRDDLCSRSGFTLLELLVVVIVITILMALLLPALNQARLAGARAACAGQLSGLGAGVAAYLSENDNIMPASAMVPSVNFNPANTQGTPVTPPYWPIQYALQNDVTGMYLPPAFATALDITTMPANVPAHDAWRCPSDSAGYTQEKTGEQFPSYFAGEGTSYQYNMTLGGNRVEASFLHTAINLQDPSIWVLADMSGFHDAPGLVSSMNILFADGHVGNATDISPYAGGRIPTTTSATPSPATQPGS